MIQPSGHLIDGAEAESNYRRERLRADFGTTRRSGPRWWRRRPAPVTRTVSTAPRCAADCLPAE